MTLGAIVFFIFIFSEVDHPKSAEVNSLEFCQQDLKSLSPAGAISNPNMGLPRPGHLELRQMSPSEVMGLFEFPETANLPTSDPALRSAIFKAFGGKCFYSGQPITINEMHIDHIIPVSLGGPNNFFNYVPTAAHHNIRKNNRFDPVAAIPALTLLRTVYSPRVESELESIKVSQRRLKIPKPDRTANIPARSRGFDVDANHAIQKFLSADENRGYQSAIHWIPSFRGKREVNPILKRFIDLVRDGPLKVTKASSDSELLVSIEISEHQIQDLLGATSEDFSEALLEGAGIIERGWSHSERRDRLSFQSGAAVLAISARTNSMIVRISDLFLGIIELQGPERQRALNGEVIPWK